MKIVKVSIKVTDDISLIPIIPYPLHIYFDNFIYLYDFDEHLTTLTLYAQRGNCGEGGYAVRMPSRPPTIPPNSQSAQVYGVDASEFVSVSAAKDGRGYVKIFLESKLDIYTNKMVRAHCVVMGCKSTSMRDKNLKFHRFPRDDRLQTWVEACDRPELKNKTVDQLYNMYVCGLHFEDYMYINKKLNKTVGIPTLNLPRPSSHAKSTQKMDLDILRVWNGKEFQNVTIVKQELISQTSTNVIPIVASTSAFKTIEQSTDSTQRKRKFSEDTTSSAKYAKITDGGNLIDDNLPDDHPTDDTPIDDTLEQFIRGCDKFLSRNLSKIVKAQASSKQDSESNRYSKEFKLFCLNLYYSSPQTYMILSKTLCLPSQRSLANSAIPVGTKITDYINGVLSQAIKHLSPYERECILCMDEMSLKRSLSYDKNKDKIIGLHEIDEIQSPYAAGYAFTITLKSLISNWKQLVGYSFITTSKIDILLEEWIVKTIKQLIDFGFKIRAVLSDQSSDFVRFSKSRGVTKEKPYFEIDGNEIFYIFEVRHLMKCVRDNLMKYNFEFNGKVISWDDINNCYQLDKEKEIRLAPKLTDSHISPNESQKQKVRLATQVLSSSVKNAMETYTKEGRLSPHDGTVEFIDIMEKLFDILNSSNILSPNPYKRPYQANELQKNLLYKAQNLFNSLKVRQKTTGKDVKTAIKFINSFLVTINAIMQLHDDLRKESAYGGYFLLTRRLSIDSPEENLGIKCKDGENQKEPTCVQFERAFRKSFKCQMSKLCNRSDSVEDFEKFLTKYGDFIQNESKYARRKEVVTTTQTPGSTNFDTPELLSFQYTCAYLWQRCNDEHKCLSLIRYASSYQTQSPKKIAYIKTRDSCGLRLPPVDFIEYCNGLETLFKNNHRCVVGNNISDKLYTILSYVEYRRPCPCFPQEFLIRLFIQMRIHYVVKCYNRELKLYKNMSRT